MMAVPVPQLLAPQWVQPHRLARRLQSVLARAGTHEGARGDAHEPLVRSMGFPRLYRLCLKCLSSGDGRSYPMEGMDGLGMWGHNGV